MARKPKPPDWESLLAHAAMLQTRVPGAVLVGGTAALRAGHQLVLGAIGGIDAGLRNQRRSAPLETTTVRLKGGGRLRIPTVAEMLRIKAFLVVERNATRDYLDVAALSHHLGLRKSAGALAPMNDLFAQFAGEGGDLLVSLAVKLANPDPYDLTEVDLSEYKGIVAPWNHWHAVQAQCSALAVALLKEPPPAAQKGGLTHYGPLGNGSGNRTA